MMYSVENRSPFLNKKLFDFCYSISPSMLIDNGYTKSILRESMRGILQENIRTDRVKKDSTAQLRH